MTKKLYHKKELEQYVVKLKKALAAEGIPFDGKRFTPHVTLVRRAAMDRLKHDTRRKRGGRQFAEALDELSDVLPSGEYVESAVEQCELSRALKAFLDSLPPDTRHIFMLRYYMSESVRQIAEKMGMQQSAVKMSLFKTFQYAICF